MDYLPTKADLRAPVFTTFRRGSGANWIRQSALVLVDSTLLCLAWKLAYKIAGSSAFPENLKDPIQLLLPVILIIHLGLMAAQGLYQYAEKHSHYLSLIKTISLSHILVLLYTFFAPLDNYVSPIILIAAWLFTIVFNCVGRLGVDLTIKRFRQQGAIGSQIFIICRPEDTQKAIKLLERENRYTILGNLETSFLEAGDIQAIVEYLRKLDVTEVFVCSWDSIKRRMYLYWNLRNAGITLNILPIGTEEPWFQYAETVFVLKKSGLPFVKLSPPIITGLDFWLKRCFDFCVSGLFIWLAAPLYLLIALIIKLDSPGPVFYQQARIGLHGKQFKVWKFRTMVINAEKLQKELEAFNEMKDGVLFKMKNDPRITRVGKFLRRYSLDELPQLFNVFWGQMSLVGPRPLPLRDVKNMADSCLIRHEILPGITGLWQVSGRSDITNFEEVVGLDIYYMENWSLWLDLKILVKTFMVLVQKKGAY